MTISLSKHRSPNIVATSTSPNDTEASTDNLRSTTDRTLAKVLFRRPITLTHKIPLLRTLRILRIILRTILLHLAVPNPKEIG